MTRTLQVKVVLLLITKVQVTAREMEVKETLVAPPIIKTKQKMVILTVKTLQKIPHHLIIRNLSGLKSYKKQACR